MHDTTRDTVLDCHLPFGIDRLTLRPVQGEVRALLEELERTREEAQCALEASRRETAAAQDEASALLVELKHAREEARCTLQASRREAALVQGEAQEAQRALVVSRAEMAAAQDEVRALLAELDHTRDELDHIREEAMHALQASAQRAAAAAQEQVQTLRAQLQHTCDEGEAQHTTSAQRQSAAPAQEGEVHTLDADQRAAAAAQGQVLALRTQFQLHESEGGEHMMQDYDTQRAAAAAQGRVRALPASAQHAVQAPATQCAAAAAVAGIIEQDEARAAHEAQAQQLPAAQEQGGVCAQQPHLEAAWEGTQGEEAQGERAQREAAPEACTHTALRKPSAVHQEQPAVRDEVRLGSVWCGVVGWGNMTRWGGMGRGYVVAFIAEGCLVHTAEQKAQE